MTDWKKIWPRYGMVSYAGLFTTRNSVLPCLNAPCVIPVMDDPPLQSELHLLITSAFNKRHLLIPAKIVAFCFPSYCGVGQRLPFNDSDYHHKYKTMIGIWKLLLYFNLVSKLKFFKTFSLMFLSNFKFSAHDK